MGNISTYLDALVKKFSRLPGIGHKSASRLAFHILNMPQEEVESLARTIVEVKKKIFTCSQCGGISDGEVCSICTDDTRDQGLLCIVEEPKDILTIDATGGYKGLFHVLHGLISPLDGIGPDDLAIAPLLDKCRDHHVREVILALNPSVEGDATSLYIAGLINPLGIEVSRIARGLPVGADLEFADNATIIKSIEGRVRI